MPEPPPAQWSADPFGRHELRYWDGSGWTDHVASHGRTAVDPPVAMPVVLASPQIPAGWYADPSGRDERRYWDGRQWTDQVVFRVPQIVDLPVEVDADPPVQPLSKKVERKARRAGAAADGEVGGGALFTETVLVVHQKAKLIGSTVGYAVYDRNGQQLGMVQEIGRDFNTKMSDRLRQRGDTTRTYRLQVVDMQNRVILRMTRPETVSKSTLVVEGPDGLSVGQICQETWGAAGAAAELANTALGGVADVIAGTRFGGSSSRLNSVMEGLAKVDHVRFGLEASGQRLGAITADTMREWDFTIRDAGGTEVGRITKTWAGWAKERFTRADNYVVQMHWPLEEPLRSLVIAAALALDIALKQGDQFHGHSSAKQLRYE